MPADPCIARPQSRAAAPSPPRRAPSTASADLASTPWPPGTDSGFLPRAGGIADEPRYLIHTSRQRNNPRTCVMRCQAARGQTFASFGLQALRQRPPGENAQGFFPAPVASPMGCHTNHAPMKGARPLSGVPGAREGEAKSTPARYFCSRMKLQRSRAPCGRGICPQRRYQRGDLRARASRVSRVPREGGEGACEAWAREARTCAFQRLSVARSRCAAAPAGCAARGLRTL